ncbi:MAG: UDP-N-acetylmuramoyl-L-alanine--D-glutamate ligase [Candidatus Omnitrophica bacterium]|nr:UDP-N-acetylmuramoyl-L-alanine--D-glutamate ligase [Candidatus Omnitrophota bacterium]
MRNAEIFKNKRIVVIGLARSGFSCARLLRSLGAQVKVSDYRDCQATRSLAEKLNLRSHSIELGNHTKGFLEGSEVVVVSPGVAPQAPSVKWAEELGIPVVSEIEIAWRLCPGKIIAVTGSNGKTTVTTLIGKIIEAAHRTVHVCGNIGNPFSGEVEKINPEDFVSLEVSSFQLEKIQQFKPEIALILNFNRNHLDRHKDMKEYLDAKKRIFINQGQDDFLILNRASPELQECVRHAKSRVIFFRAAEGLNPNQAAAWEVGKLLGIDGACMREVFNEFKGLPHRMEEVAVVGQKQFINDSKSTTAESTRWALENSARPVVLIAGGKDKGVDYGVIREVAHQKVRKAILIGEAKAKIREVLAGVVELADAATLEEAVQEGFRSALPGDCVLLSPMCSSFDMFLDYEDRGAHFKSAVLALKENYQ